ncbi:MAG TPA: acetate--CoA ligase family protein [Streptosporangiaceae bacterium]|nr:acetate--CoA ligase family protein [Streptosporangiaceae bacterium]
MTAVAHPGSGAALADAPDLHRFFHPRSVAVIGATDKQGSPGTINWRLIHRWAQRAGAEIYPVNPNRPTVDGVRAYPSLADVPEVPDVAVVMVGDVVAALREVVAKGAGFVVIFASDFAETGAEGAARQRELVSIIEGTGVRLLGPNTNLNAFENFRADLPGPAISMITQSGHQGRPVFQGQEIGIRLNHWAPTGNEADLSSADFIDYFSTLPETGAIAAYLEGVTDGPAFQRAIAAAARRAVPVVVVKVGRTEVGRSWALSHTGHLAGSDEIVSAVLRQYGVIRVEGLDELLDTATMLARSRPPAVAGVCVYSISGGTSAHMADMLTAAGVALPELEESTRTQLREWIPGYLRISNPIDNGGHPVGDWRGRKILAALLADPNVGVLVVPITGAFSPMSDKFVADLAAAAETTDKPICVVWGSPVGTEAAYCEGLLSSSRIVTFRTFRNCVTAVRAYLDFHAFQQRVHELPAEPAQQPGRTAEATRALTEPEAKRLLARYGIPVTLDVLASTADDAVAAAAEIGPPVVLKAVSAGIAHKSDLGLVRIGVTAPDDVRSTFSDFEARVAAVPGAEFDGVLVCEQASGGVEMVVGIARDEVFGPVVMAGIGGVAVEVYRDVTFRLPPFSRAEARRMIDDLRGAVLLLGHRGSPPADLDALVDVIMKVQQIALDGSVGELDINPLLVSEHGAVALDALATVIGAEAMNDEATHD